MTKTKAKKSFKITPHIMIGIAVCLVIASGVALLWKVKVRNTASKITPTTDVKVELESASRVVQSDDSGQTVFIKGEFVVTNNTSNTIGLDPNNCDHGLVINDKEIVRNNLCTAMGGVDRLKSGDSKQHIYFISAPNAKVGDSVYMIYDYMLLSDGQPLTYNRVDRHNAISNSLTIQ